MVPLAQLLEQVNQQVPLSLLGVLALGFTHLLVNLSQHSEQDGSIDFLYRCGALELLQGGRFLFGYYVIEGWLFRLDSLLLFDCGDGFLDVLYDVVLVRMDSGLASLPEWLLVFHLNWRENIIETDFVSTSRPHLDLLRFQGLDVLPVRILGLFHVHYLEVAPNQTYHY